MTITGGSSFQIKVNDEDMRRVKEFLAALKNAAPNVLARAMNKTLTGVRTDVSTEVRAIITTGKKDVDQAIGITRVTPQALTGAVVVAGKPLPLMAFSTRQTKGGVSVQIKKVSPRTVVEGAFIATMKSGHKGVFWRKWHGGSVKGLKKKIPYAKLPNLYRLPIHELFSSRVPDILSNEPVMVNVLKKAGERLHKNIGHELDYELSKL